MTISNYDFFSTGPRSSQSNNSHKPEDLQQTKTSLAEDEKTLSVFDGSMRQWKKLYSIYFDLCTNLELYEI